MTEYVLCSYTPLHSTSAGRTAVALKGYPPYVDGSCRREPDFQSDFPSISALCRASKFAPRLKPGIRVAYITRKANYGSEPGWALVAMLRVIERFESHKDAATWYRKRGVELPSNCLVPGNLPYPYEHTHQIAPRNILHRVREGLSPERAISIWDSGYQKRARNFSMFLASSVEFRELWQPPILRRVDLLRIFNRIPGTQNPPYITKRQYGELYEFAYDNHRPTACSTLQRKI